ncbi:hypothetical protein NEOLEDRAFT_1088810 [Neolentinus lepideus HHB14362 ss-1]|uniref:Uncharacterized protein n=1 Tax=Neolentinus lepideus HHB14362 ss-1 TaxID=1314782 RepID=A0A165TX58_9AGAM|nr:hypothetical protein NEOLEDRAFT_1088810 [Neolentinus lepideus HHB14362 ss-1]
MSTTASPTVLPRNQIFPELMTKAPSEPYPLPRSKPGRHTGRMRRNVQLEMEQLSDEETELENMALAQRNRGFDYMVPLGKLLTQREERNDNVRSQDDPDADASDISGETEHSPGPHSGIEEENDESGEDLDAEMEDRDEQVGDTTADTEDLEEGDTEEFEEEPSDV